MTKKATWIKDIARRTETNLMSEGLGQAESTGFMDTGSYALNMIMGGSLFHGVPNNSWTTLAGLSATGKTFFAMAIAKKFMENEVDGGVWYADTERAIPKALAEGHGMNSGHIFQAHPSSLEDLRTKVLEFVEIYSKIPADEKGKLLIVVDSLSALTSDKEDKDVTTFGDSDTANKQRNVADFTKAKVIRGFTRTVNPRITAKGIPIIVTNHLYHNTSGYGPKLVMNGGEGIKYISDAIMLLSKSKAHEDDDDKIKNIIGSKIKVTAMKGRHTKENASVEVLLDYNEGLDRYYGLLEMGIEAGIIEPLARGVKLPNGVSISRKELYRHPEQAYTEDVLKMINDGAKSLFMYGSSLKL